MKKITDVSKIAIALNGLVPDVRETVVYDWDTGELVDWTSVAIHIHRDGSDWGIVVKDDEDHKILFDRERATVLANTFDFQMRAAKNRIARMAMDGDGNE